VLLVVMLCLLAQPRMPAARRDRGAMFTGDLSRL
jgi:hypothetical protein